MPIVYEVTVMIFMKNSIDTYYAFEILNNREKRQESIWKLKQMYMHTINNNSDKEEIDNLKKIQNKFVKVKVSMDDDADKKKLFDFGVMYSLGEAILSLNEHNDEKNKLLSIVEKKEYVLSMLTYLNERHTVDLEELIEKFSGDEDEEDFLDIVEQFVKLNVISTHEIGDYIYTSLTPKGQLFIKNYSCLGDIKEKSNDIPIISENDFIRILEILSNELSNSNPSAFNVLESIDNIGVKFRNNRRVAMYIKRITATTKNYLKKTITLVCNNHTFNVPKSERLEPSVFSDESNNELLYTNVGEVENV